MTSFGRESGEHASDEEVFTFDGPFTSAIHNSVLERRQPGRAVYFITAQTWFSRYVSESPGQSLLQLNLCPSSFISERQCRLSGSQVAVGSLISFSCCLPFIRKLFLDDFFFLTLQSSVGPLFALLTTFPLPRE